MLRQSELSNEEKRLFERLGLSTIIDTGCLSIKDIYDIAMEDAFIDNKQGPDIDALRRCMNAWRISSVYRLTDEWDKMIRGETN